MYQGHNLLGHVRSLFNWAIARGVYGLDRSPCDRLRPAAVIGKKLPRKRILSDDEIRAFWAATGSMGYPYAQVFRLLLITGQRRSEVAEARWSEFDLDARLWTIPAARMKSDAAHLVALSAEAMTILGALPRFDRGDYLFSSTFGAKPINGFSVAKARLDALMAKHLPSALVPFVTHDVRRTMRTNLGALPVPDHVREIIIAHAKPGMSRVYDLFGYLDEKRAAMDLWAARLRSIVEPLPANVVTLKARG
jgi:integrase